MNLTCVKIEGGLLGPDFLEQIPDAEGQKPSDFGLPKNRTLVDEVSAVWSDVRSYWDAFQRRMQRQSSESLTSVTREQWVIPLLETLGYDLHFQRAAEEIGGRRYNISHRTDGEGGPPIHIERYDQELGERPPSGRGHVSPHAMMQDYLNRSEDLWAVVTNGRTLRFMRDSSYFTRPSYIEFDLEQMLQGERLDEFFIFYRLVHRSRLPATTEDGPECLLEAYHQLGIEQGGRIRDGLRDAVEHSLVQLGNGFLSHPKNQELRDEIREGRLTADHFYQELLYTIYRLLFLMVAEERNMLAVGDGEEHPARKFFRLSRLRDLSDEPLSSPERFDDLYLGMRTLFRVLQREDLCERLGLPPLNGELFSDSKTRHLSEAHLNNRVLLQAINTLSYFTPADEKVRRRVNYGALDVEELGSVYESLLEFQPVVSTDGTFAFVQGTERKSTGSYYTRPELVQELIKSALIPVMEDRLEEAAKAPHPRPSDTPSPPADASVRPERGNDVVVETVPGYVYELCRELRKEGTESEAILWEALRDRRLAGKKFRRQHPLGRYIADFYCAEENLVVEVDGSVHHEKRQAQYDAFREEELTGRGLNVIRVSADDVKNNLESVLTAILNTINSPSPRVERGPGGEVHMESGSGRQVDPREQALLSLTVCDPACGSGHFLLAAARRIGEELARVRTGEEAPAPDAVRDATRDVITHCIYGVDKNPLAVDLCKVALWIEGHHGEKPLTFLDHRIRCGDSLVGVFDLEVLQEPIPLNAYDDVTGDEKSVSNAIKAKNDEEAGGQATLPMDSEAEVQELAEERQLLRTLTDDTPADVRRKREIFENMEADGGKLWHDRLACNVWTAAFFAELTQENRDRGVIPTTRDLQRVRRDPRNVNGQLIGYVTDLAERLRFFHWPLEFPEVFEAGGFDAILGNPPWDKIKLEEREFFAYRHREIAKTSRKSDRSELIRRLEHANPSLWEDYRTALHSAEATSNFVRESGRFPLTAKGDVNTYALFAGLMRHLTSDRGRMGTVVKSGIATDYYTQDFFAELMQSNELRSFYDFENKLDWFPDVAAIEKFCLLTVGSAGGSGEAAPTFGFFLLDPEDIKDSLRVFSLASSELLRINPNTQNCPTFRTSIDAELTNLIYARVPILWRETPEVNPWNISFLRTFHMTNDSSKFRSKEELESDGLTRVNNRYLSSARRWLPLYEAKLFNQYDHRPNTFEGILSKDRFKMRAGTNTASPEDKQDPAFSVIPRYWVPVEEARSAVPEGWERNWLVAFRNTVQMMTNSRSTMFTVLPLVGVGNSSPGICPFQSPPCICELIANFNSMPLDYVTRQSMGGGNLNLFILKQLPVLPPEDFAVADAVFIVPRVVELVYTAWDIKAFADDVWREADDELREAIRRQWEENREATGGHEWDPPEWADVAPRPPSPQEVERGSEEDVCPLPPFMWDEDRRAVLRAELDAYYAKLYGLNRKQLRYILDPHGLSEAELEDILDPWEDPTCSGPHLLPAEPAEDFPGETFRVLKNKEEKEHGEYRTRRLVLAAWERLESGDL